MDWEHPGTQKYFTRETDEIVTLKHKKATEYMSQVIHIPKHEIDKLRPGFYGYRIDVRFRKTKPVKMPRYLADWVLSRFNYIYEDAPLIRIENEKGQSEDLKDIPSEKNDNLNIDRKTLDSSVPNFKRTCWNDLIKLGTKYDVFKLGMKRKELEEAILQAMSES